MYGVGIAFFVYCYAVLLVSPGWQAIRKAASMIKISGLRSNNGVSLNHVDASTPPDQCRVTHDGPSSGNLFLRLGFLIFGVIGIVYYSFSAFLCFGDPDCGTLNGVLDLAAIVFIFAQMHFIFCNWRVTIRGSHIVSRFGTMHLVAANLWTWIRYILIEETVMSGEIREIFYGNKNVSDQLEDASKLDESNKLSVYSASSTQQSNEISQCTDEECILGIGLSSLFT
ncbi:unnamed protein product [Anisakis simplex]|uniref:Otopetrin-2 n=1 Tax=Anisakis simplex TaxID=6269 RepID=A0A0M3KEC6_ANISI|nr:unnamed protein product [Anisakis simplex]